MSKIIYKDSDEMIADLVVKGNFPSSISVGQDNQGQVILYTNIFRWEDGTYRDYEDPDLTE